ncbi:MAG: D-glycero-beta-D-manno-heptose 1-phosphate adenylyltransferase [Deltaproteobacteria bacterium]|nr:D-glycero-beta-D-manno-heptose 1-phosphate adenylyltransferase [Deltaproteobacteria bacterium]
MGTIISLRSLKEKLKGRRKKVVFTNGCFDIIHAGHVRYLKKARSLGDILVVGLNSDASIKKLKGKGRPIVGEKERAEVLSALESVDYVILFKEETPIKLIEAIRPKVLAKGADWGHGNIVGQDFVESTGGKVVRVRLVKGRSTTDIIKKITRLAK